MDTRYIITRICQADESIEGYGFALRDVYTIEDMLEAWDRYEKRLEVEREC